MRVTPVEPDRLEEFLALSRNLHGTDPLWVPPLHAPLMAELTGQNTFGRYGQLQPFLADRNGEAVGRLAALLNPRLTDETGAPIGQIGYFESVDDPTVAGALFDRAFGWLGERGARTVWGPMNGGVHRLHRFMTAGFERTPFFTEPRNPAYYPALFEAHGFARIARWTSFDFSMTELTTLPERFGLARILKRAGRTVRVEPLPCTDIEATLARIHPLLDEVWSEHIGYTPFDREEFAEFFGGVLALLSEREIGLVVERKTGRDVGCAFLLPDHIDAIRSLDGDASRWGSWLDGPRPSRILLHTIALLPAAHRSGGQFLILQDGIQNALAAGYQEVTVSLAVDALRPLFERIAEPTREYALYARSLQRSP